MVKKKRIIFSESGFSLIEVLVSMLILSLVIYMASISCSFFLKVWGDNKILSNDKFQEYRVRKLFRSSVESSMDYMVKAFDENRTEFFVPFFEGGADKFTFVTGSSVYKSLRPAIGRLLVEKNDNGSFLLKYQEKFFEDDIMEFYDTELVFENEFILFDDIKAVKISYFGFLSEKMNIDLLRMDKVFSWQDNFSGRDKKQIPQKIKLEFMENNNTRTIIFPVRGQNPANNSRFNPLFK